MKKGIRGHDVRANGLENISRVCKEKGIEYLQLVLERSIDGFKYGDYSKEYANEIKKRLGDRKIAIFGSYINPSSVDKEALDFDIKRFKEKIEYASILDPIAVGTETGTYIEGKTFSEEAYLYLFNNIKEIVSYAERFKVNVAIEGVHMFVINTPEKLARLIKDVDSEYIKAIFDPVNYLNIENYNEQDRIISDAFDMLGDKIVCIHAKDFRVENGKMIPELPGKGLLNYELIFEKMKEYNLDIPVICEEIDEDSAIGAMNYLEGKYFK